MNKFFGFVLFVLVSVSFNAYSQSNLPIKFKAKQQSVSEDGWFSEYYFSKPVNIVFNGEQLYMYYDNNSTILKKNVTSYKKVIETEEYSDEDQDGVIEKYILSLADESMTDTTVTIIVDHRYDIDYLEVILPKISKTGEPDGMIAYRKFIEP